MNGVLALSGVGTSEIAASVAIGVMIFGARWRRGAAGRQSDNRRASFTDMYADQRRIIECVGRDLRQCVSASAIDGSGTPRLLGVKSIEIGNGVMLVLTLLDDNLAGAQSLANPSIEQGAAGAESRATEAKASALPVTFAREFSKENNCFRFLRRVGGHDEVIVRNSTELYVRVFASDDGGSVTVEACFHGIFSSALPVVSTFKVPSARGVVGEARGQVTGGDLPIPVAGLTDHGRGNFLRE